MTGSDVHHTLREMWETRPARPREDRQIAGVSAAIARRYDIDPVLVRVGFVVAAFYGIGAALYIAGWVLLPDEPGTGPVASGRRRPKALLLVLLGIAAVVGLGGASHGHGGILLPAAVVAALLFLLHRSRSGRGIAGPGAAGPDRPPVQAGSAATADPTPPAWDPLGAAPFAWDLPEPGPAPVPPPRPRSRVTPVTLALTLLAGGVTALVLLLAGGPTDVPVLLGVVLAVLGGGLLVGSFLHAGRGLIPVAVLAALVTWGVLASPFDRIPGPDMQDLRLAPTTPALLAPRYDTGLGDVDLDLRRMDLTVPAGAAATPVATRIDAGVGDVEIWVPRDADVRFTGESGVGSVTFDDQEVDGPGAELHVDDLGADRVAAGRPLVLDVQAGAGDVEVHRG
jgi:phage shock protein PspC (stress-responsive transcriptional regulator)